MTVSPLKQKPKAAPSWPADRVERRAVDDLIPYARNARTHSDAQVAQLAASIVEWGWTMPVLVDGGGGLIAGHGRVLAARKLGYTEIPVMVAAGWSEAQKRAYVIADNKLALNAEWDDALLGVELGDLQAMGADLGLVGFSNQEVADMLGGGAPEPGDGAPRGSGAYLEQYGVIVICLDEAEQEALYARLEAEGLTVKVVAT